MIRGLIFDFDGLILDTEVPDYEAWLEVFESFGCTLPRSVWCDCIGAGETYFNTYEYLEAQLGKPVDRETIRARRRSRYLALVEAQPVLPGVEQWLQDARRLGIATAVASSSSGDWAAGHLRRLGLFDYFKSVKCAADVTNTKPHPELFQCALAALDLQPHQAVALEDSLNGIRSAKQAGLYCITVPNPMTCDLPLEEADLRLNSLAELSLEQFLHTYTG